MSCLRSFPSLAAHRVRWRAVAVVCASAVPLAGCADCFDEEGRELWGTVIVRRAEAAGPGAKLLARPSAPKCAVKGVAKPPAGSNAPGADADPNLLEVARLEIERDCYKEAERTVRRRLEALLRSVDKAP